ncbi:helix-turn-helix domain-containing protein [Spirulina subsalsa FACHB-351]|uniref:Helix-turn-helix domain-containing protein n=1 Tax=Spirulina subsalsa FACHB-351 TaxID=234711 RepID=A0ABT3LAM8_9CYAN|nr:helix-turn-helix domain-containing protein [Spirulina subsalsa]MCW6038572.1 helix-turn-helix domain-containing protein [Spirulina subsalsa FACHB-351]
MELQLAVAQAGAATSTNNSVTSLGVVQSLFSQIEAELMESEIYQQAMNGLQTVTEEALSQAQSLVQSLGREAIRIAVRQIAQRYHVAPNLPKSKVVSIHTKNVAATEVEDSAAEQTPDIHPVGETREQSTPIPTLRPDTESPVEPKNQFLKLQKRMSKAQRAQLAIQERNEICQQIGKTLKEAREAQGMSIGQLHSKTLVQVFYIKALEEGRLDQLPEDIYLRGFIRRLGNTLGLDGKTLAEALPKSIQPNNAVPSWYSPGLNGGAGQVTSLHMYLGYTALVAGAVGGLAWLSSHQESVSAIVESEALPTPESVSQSSKHSQKVIPQEQTTSIAPPELMNN